METTVTYIDVVICEEFFDEMDEMRLFTWWDYIWHFCLFYELLEVFFLFFPFLEF
mgnify:CR=1 FL=1